MTKICLSFLIAIAGGFVATLTLSPDANAAYGQSDGYGYFTGSASTCAWDHVWQPKFGTRPDGTMDLSAIDFTIDPNNKRATVANFMGFLKGKYRGQLLSPGDVGYRTTQDKVGAAFIYNTMMGNKSGDVNVVGVNGISEAHFTDLQNRLNSFVDSGGEIVRVDSYPVKTNTAYVPCLGDVTSYYEPKDAIYGAYIFKKAGTEYYVIKRDCANPLGDLKGIPKSSNWAVGGSTRVQAEVRPGDTVTFEHYLTNVGPDPAVGLWFDTTADRPEAGTGSTGAPVGYNLTPNNPSRVRTETVRIPQTAAIGERYCQWIGFDPSTGSGQGRREGNRACTTVVASYEMTPYTETATTEAVPGAEVSFVYKIQKDGTTTYETTHGVVEIVVPPGADLPSEFYNQRSDNVTCDMYTGFRAGTTCTVKPSPDKATFKYDEFERTMSTEVFQIPADIAPGTRICRAYMIDSYLQKESNAHHTYNRFSSVKCVLIKQVPLVHVLGNDLRVGSPMPRGAASLGRVKGFVLTDRGTTAEYGIIAPGKVESMGSSLATVNGASLAAQSSWSKLTFANTNAPCAGGGFGCFVGSGGSLLGLGMIPDVGSFLWGLGSGIEKSEYGGNVNTSDVVASAGNFRGSRVVRASGTITINNDIKYDNAFNLGSGVTQLVLIADNINIQGNVTQVDAWLVARNSVNTCSDVPSSALTTQVCNKQLQINGPIMASQLHLNRTFVDAGAKTEPAEKLNMRGDSYIWANNLSRQNGSWQTTYTIELPPKY